MKTALVHDFLHTYGGGERVLSALVEVFPSAPIYCLSYSREIVLERFSSCQIIPSFLQKMPCMPRKYKWYLPLMPKAIESFDLSEYDLIVSDSSAYAKGVITEKPRQKHICYLHTPTRYLWSDRESYLKTAPIPFFIRPLMPVILDYLANWDLEAAKRPDYLIANSNFVNQRSQKYYSRAADEIIFPPVNTRNFYLSDIKSDYFLVVARQEPYKRTDLAIAVANKLGIKLKVVGGGTRIEELRRQAKGNVEFLGQVDDKELAKLYSEARALIFPQLEDAGITPLEAMASGTPVIAYGKGGVRESVINKVTGLFFNEQTEDSLCEAIKEFDPSNFSPILLREHAKQYDKELFKQKIRAFVDEKVQLEAQNV